MAAKTPYALLDNNPDMLPINAAGDTAPAVGGPAIASVRHRVFRFDNVTTGDTYNSGIRGIVHLATQMIGSNFLTDARLTTAMSGTDIGLVTFTIESGTPDFFLHVWSYD